MATLFCTFLLFRVDREKEKEDFTTSSLTLLNHKPHPLGFPHCSNDPTSCNPPLEIHNRNTCPLRVTLTHPPSSQHLSVTTALERETTAIHRAPVQFQKIKEEKDSNGP